MKPWKNLVYWIIFVVAVIAAAFLVLANINIAGLE